MRCTTAKLDACATAVGEIARLHLSRENGHSTVLVLSGLAAYSADHSLRLAAAKPPLASCPDPNGERDDAGQGRRLRWIEGRHSWLVVVAAHTRRTRFSRTQVPVRRPNRSHEFPSSQATTGTTRFRDECDQGERMSGNRNILSPKCCIWSVELAIRRKTIRSSEPLQGTSRFPSFTIVRLGHYISSAYPICAGTP